MTVSFPSWPEFTDEEAAAVRDVILSNKVNYWTGSIGREFEREFALWAGTEYAIALTNGTLALDLALQGLGIGARNGGAEDDEVIVTPRTFIASVSCVVTAGAKPVFADVDLQSGNISPETIAPVLGSKTKAIIPVHLGGWPADVPAIKELADNVGAAIIEDCAQAHGAAIGENSVGSIGDMGAWSFCQDKIMTTGGEGGMVTLNNHDRWSSMWSYKDHGKDWDAVYNRSHPPGFRFVHETFGTNWRMLEVQAAVGRIQLKRMDDITARRARNASHLANAIRHFPTAVRLPEPGNGITHAYYRLYAYVRPDGLKTGWDRDRIVAALVELGLPVMHGSCSEVYLEKAFENNDLRPAKRHPVARELGEYSMAFLVHPTLEDEHMQCIANGITEIMADAAR